jgi:glycosyltransferase involved in cell wall biosynthesis
MIKKILINATNLNEGGGVQVATSFLKDLSHLDFSSQLEISVFVSNSVDKNLQTEFFDKSYFFEYKVEKPKEISFINSLRLNKFDVVFTVFGPFFLPFYRKKHICGFAQPWVIYPVEDVLKKFTFIKGLFFRFKYSLIAYIFNQADVLIVESKHIKNLLVKKGFTNQIEVVENAVSSVFFNKNEWQKIDSDYFDSKKINIGVLSGGYPHKNLDFIIELACKLQKTHPNTFNFIFTLTQDKYDDLIKDRISEGIRNLGVIKLQDCPSFYHQIDGVILPSLLECFSITPYEAMLMKKIVFLSDRDFFKAPCRDHALYFDPLSVESAEEVISKWYFDACQSKKIDHINDAHKFVTNKSWSVTKANSYMSLILES